MYAACPKSPRPTSGAQGTLVVRNPKLSSTHMRSLSLLSSTSYRSIVFIHLASVSAASPRASSARASPSARAACRTSPAAMSVLISASAFASVATCFPCSASSFLSDHCFPCSASSDHPAPTKRWRSRWAAVAALPGSETRRLSVSTYDFDQVEVAARDERTVIAMSAKCFDCDNSTRFQAAVPLALAVPGTCGAAAPGGTGKQ